MGRSFRASFALDSAQVPKRRPLRRRWRRTLRNRGVLFGYFFPRPPSGDSLACSHVWLGLRVVPSWHRGALRPPTPGRASVPATMTSVASKPRRRDEEAAPRGGDFPPRTCAAVPRVRVHPLFRGENFANRRFVWRLPEHSPATFFSLAGAHVLVPRLPPRCPPRGARGFRVRWPRPAPSQRWAGSARAGRRPRPRTRCPRVCAPRADGTVWGVTCGQRSRQKQRGLPRVKFQIRTKTSGRSKPRRKEGTSKVGGRCPATAAAPGPRPWITAAPHGAPPKRAPAPEGQEGSRQRARGARDAGGWGPGAGRRAAGLLLPCP